MEYENDTQEPFLMQKDEEENIERSIQEKIREGFIYKVFGIVTYQMILLFVMVYLGFISKTFREWLLTSVTMLIITLILVIVCLFAPIFRPSLFKQVPTNYILLTLFTLSYSWWIAAYTVSFTQSSVLFSLFLTVTMVLSLTIYAFVTKKDFSSMGAFLFTALSMLIVASLIQIFVQIRLLYLIELYGGLIIFCIYLIYDVQLIVGKGNNKFGEDDYILAALNLYLDIIGIFVRILAIFGTKDN